MNALKEMAESQRNRIDCYFKHSGEKGRMNEYIVSDIIRQICPMKYSIGTGFIINSQGGTSPQCDIIVYDDFHNRALYGNSVAKIYPIECVYAFIEVKTKLTKDNLKTTLSSIKEIRDMSQQGKFYKHREFVIQKQGDDMVGGDVEIKSMVKLPPRSFIFAFETDITKNENDFQELLKQECDVEHKHFHGLLVLDRDLFVMRRPHRFDPPEFRIYHNDGLKFFMRSLLNSMRKIPMGPMDLDKYFENNNNHEAT